MKKTFLSFIFICLFAFPSFAANSVTIASGESLSDAFSLAQFIQKGGKLWRILMPSGWDAADITIQTSFDGTTYRDMYDAAGNEYTLNADADRDIVLDPYAFVSVNYIKLRSGTSGTPVNQTADREIEFVIKDIK